MTFDLRIADLHAALEAALDACRTPDDADRVVSACENGRCDAERLWRRITVDPQATLFASAFVQTRDRSED